uniref:Reverse transcriptase domain-containing protein n=1 Tax=Amphimedon queenslandica TaxID=400682 RepID=A0A1X7UKM3_AMPQE
MHLSPFGVISKKEAGKWRLIFDLSHPPSASINDGIEKSLASISYVSVDNVAEVTAELGRGSFPGKYDVQSAFKHIPKDTG